MCLKSRNHHLTFILFVATFTGHQAEDPLQTLKLKGFSQFNIRQFWMAYTEAFIANKGLKYLPKEKRLDGALSVLQKTLVLRVLIKMQMCTLSGEMASKSQHTLIVHPLYGLKISPPLHHRTSSAKWVCRLEKSLANIVHINQFRLYSLLFTRCNCNLTFHCTKPAGDRPSRNMTLCGIYSDISLFLPGHKVEIHLFYCFFSSFAFHILIDIFSHSMIESHKVWEPVSNGNYLVRTYHSDIIFSKRTVEAFHIVTEKFNIIVAYFSEYTDAEFWDGPGFLSQSLKRTGSFMKFHSFQAVIKVTTNAGLYQLNYTSVHDRLWWEKVHPVDDLQEIKHSSHQCTNENTKLCLRIFHIEAPLAKHINVSFSHFAYAGDNDTGCLYGGAALFDTTFDMYFHKTCCTQLSNFQEILTVCPSVPHFWRNLQEFYSFQNNVLVVVYSYLQYSSLEIGLKVSQNV